MLKTFIYLKIMTIDLLHVPIINMTITCSYYNNDDYM